MSVWVSWWNVSPREYGFPSGSALGITILPLGDIPSGYPHWHGIFVYYYTSREDTLILLDESHVSKMLATCVSVGSLTAVNIWRNDTRCQGTVNCKPTVSWFPIVEDVMLSRSPRVAKVCQGLSRMAECRRQQWYCLIVENNDKENNIGPSS